MFGTRAIGMSHIYLDTKIENYSNVAVGLLLRAVGHGLKVAYVDINGKATKFINFLENLSLSHSFVRKFNNFHLETFSFKGNGKVSKSILPSVEFYNIDEEIFWNSLNNFDLVIFDNCSFEKIHKFALLNFIRNRSPNLEAVFTFSKEDEFNEIKDDFDLISSYNFKVNPLIGSNKNIINVTGNGKGKSTYGFGHIIRSFIDKKDVKLIYFDKGGDFYGEKFFFSALKKWSIENDLYGKFDYVTTGLIRFDGKTFRFENIPADIKEAKEGLMLLNTALKKQTPVIAEELNTLVNSKILSVEEIVPVLNNIENELVITGRNSPQEIINLSNIIINVNEEKHYMKASQGVRKGIDF